MQIYPLIITGDTFEITESTYFSLERAIWEQGIHQPLTEGVKRHEWKAAHGFRKFYKSRAEQIMKPINVEITMGHDIGISASYYKPT
jgi:hypothetical protein